MEQSNQKKQSSSAVWNVSIIVSIIGVAIWTFSEVHSSYSFSKQRAQKLKTEERQKTIDSIQQGKELSASMAHDFYEFAKDTVRKEWVASHPYMCYKSYSRTNETCGYDKNGNRITNQFFGPFKCNNTFCIDRHHKTIAWDNYSNAGVHSSSDMKIVKVEEHPDCTSFTTYTSDKQKIVFNVPDDGKKIYSLTENETITFITSE